MSQQDNEEWVRLQGEQLPRSCDAEMDSCDNTAIWGRFINHCDGRLPHLGNYCQECATRKGMCLPKRDEKLRVVPKEEYLDYRGNTVVPLARIYFYHQAQMERFHDWLRGKTTIALDFGNIGVYVCDYEMWLNSLAKESVTVQEMFEAAIEAVEHVAQANWASRESAAKIWLSRMRQGSRDMGIDEVQQLVNDEDGQ